MVRVGPALLAPVLTPSQSLLLIILDNPWRANFCVVRVKPDLTEGTSLAQEVPTLIEFNLNLREPLPIVFGACPFLVQSMFLFDEALNITEDWLILGLIFHQVSSGENMIGTVTL